MRSMTNLGSKILILLLLIEFIGLFGMIQPLEGQPKEEVSTSPAVTPSQPSSQAPPPLPGPIPKEPVSPQPPVSPVPSQTPTQPPTVPSIPRRSTDVRTTSGGLVFNFDNADLYEVIRVMAEILKINYIIDPAVKGIVNIHTSGQIPIGDALAIFQSILKLNGATAVKKDNLYEIVPFGDAKKLYTPPSTLEEAKKIVPDGRYMIQILPLRYIPVTEASKIIKPFLTDGADIVEHPAHNILLIGDVAQNIKKILDIIALFDIDIFTDLRVRIYPILNADVVEISKEMERIFSSFEISTKSGRGVGITFTPVARINSLLVVSSIPNIFEKVEGWLKELDKTPLETRFGVFVYYCQNAKAKDLVDVLKSIFIGVKDKKEEIKAKVTEPTPRGIRQTPTPATPASTAPAQEETAAAPEGEINIVADEVNNALVIRAYARDYRTVLETVKKLDIYPRQVLIEVLLADITLNDDIQFGLEWSRYLSSKRPNAQGVIVSSQPPAPSEDGSTDGSETGSLFQALSGTVPGGIRYTIVDLGQRFIASIRAAAAEGLVNVRIAPTILASNNKEAKIQIGSSTPIPTGVFTSTTVTSTASGVVETSVEYKDIGTILTVTPRISDGGLVTMEITVEDSSLGPSVPTGPLTAAPSFNKTIAKTVLSIVEGQSIAIGGLIRNTKEVASSGIPVLNKIPLIGFLFGTKSRLADKREMILLLTPHVITDQNQSKAVTEEFREKVEGIKKGLELNDKKMK
jgi:general secretion pathway protein D